MVCEHLAQGKRFLFMPAPNHAVLLRAKTETCRPALNGTHNRNRNCRILIEFLFPINRYPDHSLDYEKYTIEYAHLRAIMNVSESVLVMPSTLTSSFLLPMKTNDFLFGEIIDEDEVYAILL